MGLCLLSFLVARWVLFSSPQNNEVFCSVREWIRDGISAPLCAKAEKKKVKASETG